MPKSNQYGPVNPHFQKCENPACINTTRRTPSNIRVGKNRFCSPRCAVLCRPRKYSDQVGEFVIKHLGQMQYADMARHFKVKPANFTKALNSLRMQGYAIPLNNKKPDHLKVKKEKIVKPPKTKVMLPLSEKPDKRANKPGGAQRKHMDRKPPVEEAKPKKDEMRFATRKVVDGPIVVQLNDKNHTKFTAKDEAHAQRIREKYAYLELPASMRF